MKKIITVLVFLISTNFFHAQCDGRFQTSIFEVDSTMNIVYGENTDVFSQNDTLTMDIYEPHGDTASIRPLIFFTHGGSFEGGDKSNDDVDSLCHRFTKMGYVTASINYRIGFYPIDSSDATMAVFRAIQDQKAAIRFFKKDRSTTNTYKIDTAQIWVGGSSAGALTALQCAYLDQPWKIPTYLSSWVAANGGLEGNSGNAGYSSKFCGAISLCGALGHKEWMDTMGIPMCAVHGNTDPIVPYGTGWASVSSVNVIIVDGDSTINAYAPLVHTEDTLYTFVGAGHVPYYGTSSAEIAYMDTTVSFINYFIYHHLNCYYADVPEVTDFNSLVIIFPDPAANNFTILIHNYDFKSYNVELIDLFGRKVLNMDNQTFNEININTNFIEAGMYFVRITKGNSVTEKKIVIY